MPVRVQINCAITLDGCLGGPGRTPLKISNAEDLKRVHALRASNDAIIVGVGTIVADDPKLAVKWDLLGRTGNHPLRVVLDPTLRTPVDRRVVADGAPTVFIARRNAPKREGWDVERVRAPRGELDLHETMDRLSARGVKSVLVEGGAKTLVRFVQRDLVDAATVFVSPRVVGVPTAPRLMESEVDLRTHLKLVKAESLGDGALLSFERRGP